MFARLLATAAAVALAVSPALAQMPQANDPYFADAQAALNNLLAMAPPLKAEADFFVLNKVPMAVCPEPQRFGAAEASAFAAGEDDPDGLHCDRRERCVKSAMKAAIAGMSSRRKQGSAVSSSSSLTTAKVCSSPAGASGGVSHAKLDPRHRQPL